MRADIEGVNSPIWRHSWGLNQSRRGKGPRGVEKGNIFAESLGDAGPELIKIGKEY